MSEHEFLGECPPQPEALHLQLQGHEPVVTAPEACEQPKMRPVAVEEELGYNPS